MKKVQIQSRPPTKAIYPCDKLSSYPFNWDDPDEYARCLTSGNSFAMDENYKGELFEVKYWLKLEGYEDKLPPDARHREVLFVCMSLYEQGYREVTFDMIMRAMTGGSQQVSYNRVELKEILRKLIFTGITVDIEPLKKFPKYRERIEAAKIKNYKVSGALLPAKIHEASVNGQEAQVIEMLSTSPLRDIAEIKQQLIKINTTPLAVPNQHDTIQVASIKNWLLRRIELSAPSRKGHLNPSILFETIFKECGLVGASNSTKRNIRKEIVDALNHFKKSGVIKDFELVKEGRVYRSISIIHKSYSN